MDPKKKMEEFSNNTECFDDGDDHHATSFDNPIKKDAFLKNDNEKIENPNPKIIP